MMICAKQRGPCSGKPAPEPPKRPPPPPKKFPWIYPFVVGTFLGLIGMIYKIYLYKEDQDKAAEGKPIWRPRPANKRPLHDRDLPACVQYLIVGAGTAGWAAYRSILEHDKTAKVFFIGKDDTYPYRQPPMSKQMWYNSEPPEIRHLNYLDEGVRKTLYYTACKNFLDPVKFYRRKSGPAVSIAMGWNVVRVDADEHCVYVKTLCGERPIYYERCLLAVGSKANQLSIFKTAPKAVRDRVATLRTVRDLEVAYRKARDARHVTIIGAGPLGSELAYHMGRMSKEWYPPPDADHPPPKILHVYKDKGILSGIIPEYLGEWAAEKLKCENVSIMPQAQVYDAFPSDDGRLELTLSNGNSVKTDFVIVCVGARPREELALPSDLELDPVNGGFLVNTELEARTHLYVAGDAASVFSQWKNSRLRMEHYINAQEQGHLAGTNMTGHWAPCNIEPHYWVVLGNDIEMEVVGEVGACMPTVALFKPCDVMEESDIVKAYEEKIGEHKRPCYKDSKEYKNRYKRGLLFYLRDETIVGMVFWNLTSVDDRKEVVTEMLRAKPTYHDINLLAELLGFAAQECVIVPHTEVLEPGPCIKNSKWLPYEEYEKIRELSKVQYPEIYTPPPPRPE